MNTLRIPSCFLLILAAVSAAPSPASGASGTSQVASKGVPYFAKKLAWPEGTLALVNHPLRGNGWNDWFTQLPNDVCVFELKVRNEKDVQELIDLLAKVKGGARCVLLSPHGNHYVNSSAPDPEAPRSSEIPTAATFSIGDQTILDKWYERLPKDETGARKFGAHRYEKPPTARPPTLTLYVGSPALEDLTKIRVPADVELRPDFNDVWGKEYQSDWRVKRIVQFVAEHNAKKAASQKAKGKDGSL